MKWLTQRSMRQILIIVLIFVTLGIGYGIAKDPAKSDPATTNAVAKAPEAKAPEAATAQNPERLAAENAAADPEAQAYTAGRKLSRMRMTTPAQRQAAANARIKAMAAEAAAQSGKNKNASRSAQAAGVVRSATTGTVPGQPLPAGIAVCRAFGALALPAGNAANADYMGLCPNYAYSPLLTKFKDRLPGLGIANKNINGQYIPIAKPMTTYPGGAAFPASWGSNFDYYEIGLKQYEEQMHSDLPGTTKLRGYLDLNGVPSTWMSDATQPHYLGPLILAEKNRPVRIKFVNGLPTGALGKSPLPVDTSIMGAGDGPAGGVYTDNRANLHMHGGNTPWISDGTPHQWITPAGDTSAPYKKGVSFQNVPDMVGAGTTVVSPNENDGIGTYYYTNQQSGRLMFYHDHSYGTTRLNVYGGAAAGYLLVDPEERTMMDFGAIPGKTGTGATATYDYGIPLIIQDKTFVSGAPGAAPTGTFLTDPTWSSVVPAGTKAGDLWFPHVYMPNQNPSGPNNMLGSNAMGRWDYGPWFWPPYTGLAHRAVPCPEIGDPTQMCPGTLNPSLVPESFMDTPLVNGTPYPYVDLQPTTYRFRILNAMNDRHVGLGLYVAEPLTIGVLNGGSGYTLIPPPTVTFSPAGATATALISTGSVTGINWTAAGTGYAAPPTVTFTGGGGTGAAAQVTLLIGSISSVTILNGGTGYTSAPFVTFSTSTGGRTATGTADITPAGVVTGFTVSNPGTYTTVPPIVTLSAPSAPGVQATAIASLNTEIKVLDAIPHPGVGSPPVDLVPPCLDFSPEALYLAGKPTGIPSGCWPAKWPTDARPSGAPDPRTAGPAMVQIGTEGGLLPAPYVISSQPTTYNMNKRDITVLNVLDKGLFLGPAERADVLVDFTAFAGKTLILYNDAPAPVPATDTRLDYYTGNPDQTDNGGTPSTLPGFGPNIRTIMQIRVGLTTSTPFILDLTKLKSSLAQAFRTSFPANVPGEGLIVPQSAYNTVYGGPFIDNYARITDTTMTFTPIGGTVPVMYDMQPKAIQELFDPEYGKMNSTLGVELPNSNAATQTTIPLGYIDPPTEVLNTGETQVWKITHNGVDTHAIHFHLFNVQVINRVGWDGAIRVPDQNEMGWKETVRMSPLEDVIIALRPVKMTLPWIIPQSVRLLDPTRPEGATGPQFTNINPLTNGPMTTVNQMTNFGWEYVWHCHLLGHEENDMMRPIVFNTEPINIPTAVTAVDNTKTAPFGPLNVIVSWTFVDNPGNKATGFRILRSIGAVTNVVATINNITTFSWIDRNVVYNTTYGYRVIAFNAQAISIPSNMATVTTPKPQPPPTPTGLRAMLLARTSITLAWTAVPGATSYIVQRLVNGIWIQVALPTPAITMRVTGLTNGTSYSFRVLATNAAGNSAPTGILVVKTLP